MEGGSTLKLFIDKGPREGETLEFKPGSVIRIGRVVRGNTLAIKDAGISSNHLSIEFKNSKWVVTDLDSSNGTVLNSAELSPTIPFDLHHGDVIKLGEYTSIKLHIEDQPTADHPTHNLRQNPRRQQRGVASKDENCEGLDTAVENVGGGRRVGSRRTRGLKEVRNVGENCEDLDHVGSVAENLPRRGRPRRGRVLKEDNSETDVQNVGEKCNLKVGDKVGSVAENRTRRGRPKREVSKNENAEDLCEHQEEGKLGIGRELENVGPVEPKQGRHMSLRRTRSSKNDEPLISGSAIQKIPESSGLDQVDCGEVEVEDKKTRAGAQRKKNLRDEPSGVVQIDDSEDEKIVEGLNLRQETCKESASTSGVKESCAEVGNGPDLEKMTLGEWFDYLEVHLPKQICDVTEEMISTMRRKAEQFHEYMLQQQNEKEKGKLPIG